MPDFEHRHADSRHNHQEEDTQDRNSEKDSSQGHNKAVGDQVLTNEADIKEEDQQPDSPDQDPRSQASPTNDNQGNSTSQNDTNQGNDTAQDDPDKWEAERESELLATNEADQQPAAASTASINSVGEAEDNQEESEVKETEGNKAVVQTTVDEDQDQLKSCGSKETEENKADVQTTIDEDQDQPQSHGSLNVDEKLQSDDIKQTEVDENQNPTDGQVDDITDLNADAAQQDSANKMETVHANQVSEETKQDGDVAMDDSLTVDLKEAENLPATAEPEDEHQLTARAAPDYEDSASPTIHSSHQPKPQASPVPSSSLHSPNSNASSSHVSLNRQKQRANRFSYNVNVGARNSFNHANSQRPPGHKRRTVRQSQPTLSDDVAPPPWGGPRVLPPIANSWRNPKNSNKHPDGPDDGLVSRPHIPPLSIRIKLQVLLSHRELCYRESTWTKKRIEKLHALGLTSSSTITRTRSAVEERRWAMLLDELMENPEKVVLFWGFIQKEFPYLHDELDDAYQQRIRAYYKPMLVDLQSTKANHQRMREILVHITDQYDQELTKLEEVSQARKEELLEGKEKLIRNRKDLQDLAWAEGLEGKSDLVSSNQEGETPTESIDKVVSDIMQISLTVIQAKNSLVDELTKENEDLKRKASGLKKSLDERKKQLKDTVSIGTETEKEANRTRPGRMAPPTEKEANQTRPGRTAPPRSKARITPRAGNPYKKFPAKPA